MAASQALYARIRDAIPPRLFRYAAAKDEAILNIYLTATGVRPACMPFEGEVRYGGKPANDMLQRLLKKPTALDALRAIPDLAVAIGPYFDVGQSVVVYNTTTGSPATRLLARLDVIDASVGRRRYEHPEIHILLGRLLGYTCPLDLSTVRADDPLYEVAFMIDGVPCLRSWCRPTSARFLSRARQQLDAINAAIAPLDKRATLCITPARR